MKASVNRVFNSSMEVGVSVYSEDLRSGVKFHCNSGFFTFVCLNPEINKTIIIRKNIQPESKDEKRRYIEALNRRKRRLSMERK